MKVFYAVLIVMSAFSYSHAFDKAQAEEMAKEILTFCKEKEGGTDADYAKLIKLDYPHTPTGNCMVACAHEKMALFDNGSFLKENFIGLARMLVNNDPELMELVMDVSDHCGKVKGPRCDQAIDFYKCLEGEAKKRGVERPEII